MDYDMLRLAADPVPHGTRFRKLYVCSPLSAPSWLEVNENMHNARYYAAAVGRYYGCRAVAPHAWLPLMLDDNDPAERALALEFGLKLLETCDGLVVCGKRISNGMRGEIERALELGIPILFLEDMR